ncbi:MAG: hypothetical protein HC784_14205, partial [Hydrococcus sp. CSU_1_8]|nr:hypothetical protein [Hydrococcus sp. CSU_1_8]
MGSPMESVHRINILPSFVKGAISKHYYDGVSDDLLTAGLGQDGLINLPPTAADPENPTSAEIRRATIVNQYKGLVDLRAKAGYGTLYGCAVPSRFSTPSGDGKVAGKEYIAYADDGSNCQNVNNDGADSRHFRSAEVPARAHRVPGVDRAARLAVRAGECARSLSRRLSSRGTGRRRLPCGPPRSPGSATPPSGIRVWSASASLPASSRCCSPRSPSTTVTASSIVRPISWSRTSTKPANWATCASCAPSS